MLAAQLPRPLVARGTAPFRDAPMRPKRCRIEGFHVHSAILLRTSVGRLRMSRSLTVATVVALTVTLATPVLSQTPKPGGTLNVTQREDVPQGFAIHETQTSSTVWPSMPCFNNLVVYDPAKKTETMETIIGDLAEKWSWQDNYRNLVFFLRKGV